MYNGASQVALVVKKSASQCRRCRRHGFYPRVGKIPWRRKWQNHSSILAWEIPWTEESRELQFMGVAESDPTEHTHTPCRVCNLMF